MTDWNNLERNELASSVSNRLTAGLECSDNKKQANLLNELIESHFLTHLLTC